MLTNRDGRPRSAIKQAVPNPNATSDKREERRRSGRNTAPNVDDAPATPPRKKYAGTNHFHTGRFSSGTS
jgi:hypothetical protein